MHRLNSMGEQLVSLCMPCQCLAGSAGESILCLCSSALSSERGWIDVSGADRVLAMDLHSGQCVGYFDIPVDHVYGDSVILDYLASKRISTGDLVRAIFKALSQKHCSQ